MLPWKSRNEMKRLLFAVVLVAVLVAAYRFGADAPRTTPMDAHTVSSRAFAAVPSALRDGATPPRAWSQTPPAGSAMSLTGAPAPDSRVSMLPRPAMAPLPADLPLREVAARLQAAADLGDPQAACRLGVALAQCPRLEDFTLGRPASDRQIAEYHARCDGLPAHLQGQAWRYLVSAAEAGSVPAMTQFALDPGLSRADPALDLDGWIAYRDKGPAILWQAIQAGEKFALQSAFLSAKTGASSFGRPAQRDSYQAMVFGTALYLKLGRDIAALEGPSDLTPALAAQARQEGIDLYHRYFEMSPKQPRHWSGSDPLSCGR